MFHLDGQRLNFSVELCNDSLEPFDLCRLRFDNLIVKADEDAGKHEGKKPYFLRQRNGSKDFNVEIWEFHGKLTLQTETKLKLINIDLAFSRRFTFYKIDIGEIVGAAE